MEQWDPQGDTVTSDAPASVENPAYYCPECGTWYKENKPYCTGPQNEPQLQHEAAFLLAEGTEVDGMRFDSVENRNVPVKHTLAPPEGFKE